MNDLGGFAGDLRSLVFETHQKAATHVNVNRATIARYESGAIRPPKGYLACLARLVAAQQDENIVKRYEEALLQEVNQAVRHHYRGTRFTDWNDLCQVADEYLNGRNGNPPGGTKLVLELLLKYARPLIATAAFLFVALAIIVIVRGCLPPPPPCEFISARPPIPGAAINGLKVEITPPEGCYLPAGQHKGIEGTYSGDLAERQIWVLIYASDRKYYPQSANACLMLPAEADRRHWVTTFFDRTVEQLDIVVTVADVEASQVFKDWLKAGCDTGKFPGIPVSELPAGLSEMASITLWTE